MSNSHLYAPRFSSGADSQEKITERVNGPASHLHPGYFFFLLMLFCQNKK